MIQNHFSNIWGDKETRFSAIIAQTLLVSKRFREFLSKKIWLDEKTFEIEYINTEEQFNEDRIDIYIRTIDEVIIGIENKKWAVFQPNQLRKYDGYLKRKVKKSSKYRLIFLAPSSYKLLEDMKPENLITIRYKEIIDWIDKESSSFDNDFENNYFENLKAYLGVLEMKEIDEKEIASLTYVREYMSIINKVKKILSDIKETKLGFEELQDGYYLTRIHVQLLYAGIRFDDRWYYGDDFNENEPEFIVYIKDNWSDDEQEIYNQKIESIYNNIQNHITPNDFIRLYPRNKKNKARLVIKRSIKDFKDKDISEVSNWFRNNINLLESNLKEHEIINEIVK